MRFLKTGLFAMTLLFIGCGDDDTDQGNLGPGETCTVDIECTSNDCTAGLCVGPGGADGGTTTPDGGIVTFDSGGTPDSVFSGGDGGI